MTYTQTLYQYDSKGKIKQWSVHVEGDSTVVTHGKQGGKLQEKRVKCKGKNLGKANETTPEAQAHLEAQSLWNAKVTLEDYHWDVEQSGKQLRAMLALDYTKDAHRVDWSKPHCVQPKLDGLRLTYGYRYEDSPEPELLTRKGKTYKVYHIEQECDALLSIVESKLIEQGSQALCRSLDGEIYKHGMSLQEINSRSKKYRQGLTEELEYHLFDLVVDGLCFADRSFILRIAFEEYVKECPATKLRLVQTGHCASDLTLKEYHGTYAEQGYEGVMLRNCESLYNNGGRGVGLFKYKEFMDAEFKIVDVWEDKNGNAMFNCELSDGRVFGCTPKRSHEERKQMLTCPEQYIGQWLTVKFQAYTPEGFPEFPVGLGVRECTEDGEAVV